MSAEPNLQEYNAVARQALVPFDESEISQRKQNPNVESSPTFSYVPPERYRYKALRVFKNGFTFGVLPESIQVGKNGVTAAFRFNAVVDDPETMTSVEYDVTLPVFEPWTLSRESKEILNGDQTFSKLASAGFKACMRELGMGLHLYDKPARSVSGAPKSKPAAEAAPVADDGSWDGTAPLPINVKGLKGTPYKDLEDSLITWLCTKENPDKGAIKERARREKIAGSSPQVDENEDIPF